MKIKITDEMLSDAVEAYDRTDGHASALHAALERVLAIVERDYEISGGPIPDDVIRVTDRDGDTWGKLMDGRWVYIGEGTVRPTIADVRGDYGPLTW